LALATFAVLIGAQIIFRTGLFPENSRRFQMVAWLNSLTVSLWAPFIILCIPLDILTLLFDGAFRLGITGHEIAFETISALHWAIFALSVLIAVVGTIQALSGPRVKKVAVPITGLPKELEGLKIAQISDLHVGPTIRHGYVNNVVQKVLRLEPDLIAVTGDIADGNPQSLAPHFKPLGHLKARLGTYYITGNHEYYWGAEAWIEALRELGFTPLINQNKTVTEKGVKIMVAGVADTSAHHFIPAHRTDPQKAASTAEDVRFKLLLAHRPDSSEAAEPFGFHLQLSGHTHGGQFFPFRLLARMAHRYFWGLHKHGNMWVYVNAGTGYWGPAQRFSVPSEITLLTLAPAAI
jgi:predicted MPP superfamily phosphohydrolase